jgi:superfamily II DNA or RNA helicase
MQSYAWSEGLWSPQVSCLDAAWDASEPGKVVGIQSPTGTGKTRMSMELFRRSMIEQNAGGLFMVNRKLLVQQTYNQLTAAGLPSAVRAAEYEDMFDAEMPFQVSSAPSEQSRTYKTNRWQLHEVGNGGVVVIDEAHIQKSKTIKNMLYYYRQAGARIFSISATPVNMKGWIDELVVSARMQEWRDAGALVPVTTLTCSQPDLRKIKRSVSGEYVLDDRKKKLFTQHIVGEVVENLKKNHDGNPCVIYAPNVASSRYLARECNQAGMKIIHGKAYKLDRSLWSDIVAMVSGGDYHGMSCRFKLREGVDIKSISLVVTATPVGSISSFLQLCGRGMRAAPNKTRMILQDHGGCYHQHGSPNCNQPWEMLWQLSDHAASTYRTSQVAEGKEPEPIRCPACGAERRVGRKCFECGFEHERSVRIVVQEDGELREVTGDMIKRVRRLHKSDTEELWRKMFYGFRRNPKNTRTFSQMMAFFVKENGYRPRLDLPFMPRRELDWRMRVSDVPMSRLIGETKEKLT